MVNRAGKPSVEDGFCSPIPSCARTHGFVHRVPVPRLDGCSRAAIESNTWEFCALETLVGKSLLHYTIVKKLGSGGMGVVYEAQDAKLGRDVALKFLSRDFEQDPGALERFKQEARAASALNHPAICTIYAIEECDGQHFIAMELLQGESLNEKINGQPL